MPDSISKQLLEIREKPKDMQLNDEAVRSVLGEAMRAVRKSRSGEGMELERPNSGYGQVGEAKFAVSKESDSQPLNDTRGRMKDVFELLRKKEMDLCRVRQEIESLRLVIPLLVEDIEQRETTSPSSTTQDADAVVRKAVQLVPAAQDPTAGRREGWLPGKLLDLS
jgi:hypothetical protein